MDTFQSPNPFYRGTDLWMLNDRLEEEELRRQIRQMHDKGFHSFIARTYNGLISDYPGEEFLSHMGVIIDEAKKHGMKVFLQAGYMPAACVDLPRDRALHYLKPQEDGSFDFEVSQTAVDLFSRDAIAYYIELSYTQMWQRFSSEFGKTVYSIWLDEPRYDPKRLPWTKELPFLYRERYQEELTPLLPLLYEDGDRAKEVRYRYFTILRDLLAQNYFGQVRAWCDAHHLKFSGHLMCEDYLKGMIADACAVMPYYKYFDIPGIDCLQVDMNYPQDPVRQRSRLNQEHQMYNTPIQCVSAAHQAGKEHILCEMYGVTTTDLTFRKQKQIFDHFAALGINHRCVHAPFYSLKGFRKRFYPHQVNYYQPYWDRYKTVTDYVARVSKFVSMGEAQVDTVVLHPLETAYGLYRGILHPESTQLSDRRGLENKELDAYDETFHRLLMDLTSNQCSFELCCMTDLGDGIIEGTSLRIGKMIYRRLVLPWIEVLDQRSLDLICRFAQNGGEVIFLGQIPERLEGALCFDMTQRLEAFPHKRCEDIQGLIRHLHTVHTPTVKVDCPACRGGLIVHCRRDQDTHYTMVYTHDCSEKKEIALRQKGCARWEQWHPEDGSVEALPAVFDGMETVCERTLPAGGSLLLVSYPCREAELLPQKATRRSAFSLPKTWEATFVNPNLYPLEECRYALEDGIFSEKISVFQAERILFASHYVGRITLEFSFCSAYEAKGLSVILEEAEKYRVRFNGVPVDCAQEQGYFYDKSFRIYSLPDVCRKGENLLQITGHYEGQRPSANHLMELFKTRNGVDLEMPVLLGDFTVDALPQHTLTGNLRYSRRFRLSPPRAVRVGCDATGVGYPFYVGEMKLRCKVELTEADLAHREICFSLAALRGCAAQVYVNGIDCGQLAWEPYRLSIKGAVQAGENEILLSLVGTLRNLTGPFHHVDMECGSCSTLQWYLTEADYFVREYDTERWTSDYMMVPYGIEGAEIVMK